MRIASIGESLPPYVHPQAEITARLKEMWAGDPWAIDRLGKLHENVEVRQRHLSLPLEQYAALGGFGEVNDIWIRVAVELGEAAVAKALARACLTPRDVDVIFFSTVTGLASPSIDARLSNRMGFRSDVKRVPMFGLGCVAGAAAVSRAADYVRAYPGQVALVLTIELCSLTLQLGDRSVANLISTGLFGDGATCAVIVGEERDEAGPEVLATRSIFYPDTEDVMGWEISEQGFRIVLSASVSTIARERLPGDVRSFLSDQGLRQEHIGAWVCHPGGPKVLRGLQHGLGLPDTAVAASWDVLGQYGNLSSASVLLVLEKVMRSGPAPGTYGVMLAMGPGFCSELLLLRW